MKKKIILILVFTIGTVLFTSCCKDTIYFNLTSISLNHLDNSFESGYISYADSILASAYGIKVNLEYTRESSRIVNLFNTGNLYATSCSLEEICLNKIESITITSTTIFDSLHSADTSLNDLFIINNEFNSSGLTIDLNEFIDFFNDEETTIPSFELLLMDSPANEDEFIFTIIIELDNGAVITADSNPVYLELENE